MLRTISMVSHLTIWNFGSLFACVLDTLEYISEHVDKRFMDDINSPVGK